MKALMKLFVLLLVGAGLASCGGGGGGSQHAFTPTPVDSITITTAASSIPTFSFTTITVTVKKQDGTVENNGTTINASLSPTTIGTISGAGTTSGATASNTLSGGQTTFVFNSSNQTGNATITISVPAGTNGATTTATAMTTIAVAAGNTQDPRLQIASTATTLPVSPYTFAVQQVTPFPGNYVGSPYVTEVTVTWRRTNGSLVNSGNINVSASPSSVIQLSTGSGTEFQTLKSSATIPVVAGTATFFVHSGTQSGPAAITVTAIDPDSGQTITSQLDFNIAGAATGVPTSVSFTAGGAVYISNSGGPQSTVLTATVTDGSNGLIGDPNGFNNVQFTIVGPANNDAKLAAVNAAGQQVVGTTVVTTTHNGVAAVTFEAGTQQGPVQVRVTVDRGDNNVDNGIQDPVSATTAVIVSDGKLFSLTLTEPITSAIRANAVSNDVTATVSTIPPDPNATYSLTVTALATDRQGNPVLPGTQIKFGSIDAPQTNGFFDISGVQGNPQEGGTLFTATDGHFRTAGGGAGPGDTLIVFGKEVPGNSDLESAAKVSQVLSETSLNVAQPFNRNDTTGASVDYGPVLPYIIGRAQTGNISSPATTNAFGAATTTLNYPVSALGRTVAIWAQGVGTDTVTGGTDIVTDADIIVFPGIAPATIVISPNPIPGNLTTNVYACIRDALLSPISGVHFNFVFSNLGIGTATLDGINGAGTVPDATDATGCVTTTVTTNGIAGNTGGTGAPTLTFSFGQTTASAPIVASGDLILIAVPSLLSGEGGNVTLTLLSGNSQPVPGVQIVGTCEGDPTVGIVKGPTITDSQGHSFVTIKASLDAVGGGKSATCTFTTSTGSPSAVVKLQGSDSCLTSPQPAACNPTLAQFNLSVTLQSGDGTGFGGLGSTPAGVTLVPSGSCQMPDAAHPVSCVGVFNQNTSVTLSALGIGSNQTTSVKWSQNCSTAGTGTTATVVMTGNKACTLTFNPVP